MTNSNTSFTDSKGYTVHPDRPTCPNCLAFNVGRRCGCTAHKAAPVDLDSIEIFIPAHKTGVAL